MGFKKHDHRVNNTSPTATLFCAPRSVRKIFYLSKKASSPSQSGHLGIEGHDSPDPRHMLCRKPKSSPKLEAFANKCRVLYIADLAGRTMPTSSSNSGTILLRRSCSINTPIPTHTSARPSLRLRVTHNLSGTKTGTFRLACKGSL